MFAFCLMSTFNMQGKLNYIKEKKLIISCKPVDYFKGILSSCLKAHVHPNGFARLCFCFETILLSNAVF